MDKQREKMRGGIRRSGRGRYEIRISKRNAETGSREQYQEFFKGTRLQAEGRRAELIHDLNTGAFMKPGSTTLADYLERWIKDYARPKLSPKSAEWYEYLITQHLIPGLGQLKLNQVKPEHLERYYADKLATGRCDGRGGLSAQSIRHHYTALHSAFETARQWGLLRFNPCDNAKPPTPGRHEMQTWDKVEIESFLEAAMETEYYPLFFLALYTGMRRSELLALRWQDVDLTLGQIYVSRSLQHLQDGKTVIREPKTARSRRTVALPPSASIVLREHRLNYAQVDNAGYVFCHADGSPLLPNSVSHGWLKLVRKTGLKPIRLHDARHSHASLLLKQGIHPKVVQERLGHSSIGITLDTYSHVAPGMQEAAAASFDALFQTSKN